MTSPNNNNPNANQNIFSNKNSTSGTMFTNGNNNPNPQNIFGQNNKNNNPPNNSNANQQQNSNSMFGAQKTNTNSIFGGGNNQNKNEQPTTSNGIFGGPNQATTGANSWGNKTTQNKPTGVNNIFQNPQTSGQQMTNPPANQGLNLGNNNSNATGGIFNQNNPQSNVPQTGNILGQNTANSNQPNKKENPTNNIFSNHNNTGNQPSNTGNQPAGQNSLNNQLNLHNNQAPQPNIFGGNANKPAEHTPSVGGGLNGIFGGNAANFTAQQGANLTQQTVNPLIVNQGTSGVLNTNQNQQGGLFSGNKPADQKSVNQPISTGNQPNNTSNQPIPSQNQGNTAQNPGTGNNLFNNANKTTVTGNNPLNSNPQTGAQNATSGTGGIFSNQNTAPQGQNPPAGQQNPLGGQQNPPASNQPNSNQGGSNQPASSNPVGVNLSTSANQPQRNPIQIQFDKISTKTVKQYINNCRSQMEQMYSELTKYSGNLLRYQQDRQENIKIFNNFEEIKPQFLNNADLSNRILTNLEQQQEQLERNLDFILTQVEAQRCQHPIGNSMRDYVHLSQQVLEFQQENQIENNEAANHPSHMQLLLLYSSLDKIQTDVDNMSQFLEVTFGKSNNSQGFSNESYRISQYTRF